MDELDVRDVMPMVAGAINLPGGLDGVECQPDGAVADGVEVRLEASAIQVDDGLTEQVGIDERNAGLTIGPCMARS